MSYKSLYVTTIVGSNKGQSLYVSTRVGSFKGESLKTTTAVGTFKSRSNTINIEAGYADITWIYDEPSKSAIGTLNYPLYSSAKFKLIATDQVKNPDNIAIINPQEHDYIT
jgi:hypothetical protein